MPSPAFAIRTLSQPGNTTRLSAAVIDWRRCVAIISAVLLLVAAAHTVQMWLSYDEVWTHPELIGSGDHVWSDPDKEGWRERLAKAAEINDPNRVRPLSKLTEVVDAIARPYVARALVPHPTLTPSTVLTLVVPPIMLALALRRLGLGMLPIAGLLVVFLSSTGYLSTITPYDRPAKKLTFVFFSVSLYFAVRHARYGGTRAFLGLIAALLCSFFSDEEGLAFFIVFGVVFFPSLLRRAPNWKRAGFLALPLIFVVGAEWGLRAFYNRAATLRGFDPLGESEKFVVLGRLANPAFYPTGLHGLAQGILSSLGVRLHTVTTEAATLVVLVLGSALLARRLAHRPGCGAIAYQVIASAVALTAAGIYVTVLDQYPTPGSFGTNGRGYMGEFTYYYHSSLALSVVVWLACAWQGLVRLFSDERFRRVIVGAGVALCAGVFAGNVALFQDVNRLMQIIHTYPYSSPRMYASVLSELPTIKSTPDGQAIPIAFQRDDQELAQEFDRELLDLFGGNIDTSNNGFYQTMHYFWSKPMMDAANLRGTLHMYFPYNRFEITDDG